MESQWDKPEEVTMLQDAKLQVCHLFCPTLFLLLLLFFLLIRNGFGDVGGEGELGISQEDFNAPETHW